MTDEQAVIVRYALNGEGFRAKGDRDAVRELEDELALAIAGGGVGMFDGDLFGGGEVELYAYGPDADALFRVMEPILRKFPARPASAVLRYGQPLDPSTTKRRIDL